MKKFIKISIFSIFAILMIVGFSNHALAIVRTSNIVFENTPLFGLADTGELNFAPGDSISRWVKITNSTNENHRAIVRALDVYNSDKFGDAISLQIKKGNVLLYNGTFSEFFSKSEVLLPQVKAGETIQIDFIATFISESNNDYQNNNMGFSLQIGLEDVEYSTDRTTSIGGSGSLLLGQKNLIISNENASYSEDGSGPITISWDTNNPATSQVIYGLSSMGPYVLDLSAPNFGYPFSTTEKDLDVNKKINHVVDIPNLTAGEYVYRVVSRASPATVSYEHRFVVFEKNIVNIDNKINTNNNIGAVVALESDKIDSILLKEDAIEKDNLLTASAGNIMGVPNSWFWFSLIFLIILIIFLIIYRKRKDRKEKE